MLGLRLQAEKQISPTTRRGAASKGSLSRENVYPQGKELQLTGGGSPSLRGRGELQWTPLFKVPASGHEANEEISQGLG